MTTSLRPMRAFHVPARAASARASNFRHPRGSLAACAAAFAALSTLAAGCGGIEGDYELTLEVAPAPSPVPEVYVATADGPWRSVSVGAGTNQIRVAERYRLAVHCPGWGTFVDHSTITDELTRPLRCPVRPEVTGVTLDLQGSPPGPGPLELTVQELTHDIPRVTGPTALDITTTGGPIDVGLVQRGEDGAPEALAIHRDLSLETPPPPLDLSEGWTMLSPARVSVPSAPEPSEDLYATVALVTANGTSINLQPPGDTFAFALADPAALEEGDQYGLHLWEIGEMTVRRSHFWIRSPEPVQEMTLPPTIDSFVVRAIDGGLLLSVPEIEGATKYAMAPPRPESRLESRLVIQFSASWMAAQQKDAWFHQTMDEELPTGETIAPAGEWSLVATRQDERAGEWHNWGTALRHTF